MNESGSGTIMIKKYEPVQKKTTLQLRVIKKGQEGERRLGGFDQNTATILCDCMLCKWYKMPLIWNVTHISSYGKRGLI